MPLAISLWMDEESELRVREIWKNLHEEKLSSKFWLGPYRPHVTLVVADGMELEIVRERIRQVVSEMPAFELDFSFVGVFPLREELVVFLGVAPTPHLLRLQSEIYSLTQSLGGVSGPYYAVGRWNPHCTLARATDIGLESPIISYCKKIALPFQALINRIGIVETPEEVELASINLAFR